MPYVMFNLFMDNGYTLNSDGNVLNEQGQVVLTKGTKVSVASLDSAVEYVIIRETGVLPQEAGIIRKPIQLR